MKRPWYEITDRFMPACWHAAKLSELAQQRGINDHQLLRGTSLFPRDLCNLDFKVSPLELSQLFVNARNLSTTQGLSFLYGDGLLPGFSPHLSNALTYAENLAQTLEALHTYPLLAFPMLRLKLVTTNQESGIELVNIFGLTDSYHFCAEAALSGIQSWVKWQSKLHIPWRFELNFPKPSYYQEYELYFEHSQNFKKFRFNSVRCRMMVDNSYLFQKWPKGSRSAFELALQDLSRQKLWQTQQGFCGEVINAINQNLAGEVNLEQIASIFQISTSSLKRKLKQHNTSFQKLLDQCRAAKAVELMEQRSLNTEQLSVALKIPDPSNFRKSFKKWTGFTPKGYKEAFNLV